MNNTISPQPAPPRTSKKGVALGLTAGLVGGSIAGLMLGMPGLSSAAVDDGANAAPAAVVQQVDDPAVDGPAVDAPAERGERLREVLEALVDDGTLTAGQADAVTAHLIENRPERGDRRHRGDHGNRGPGHIVRSEVLAELLGIEADDLREQLRSGSTLAEIAAANGVETSAVIDALVAQAEERINAAVDAERITADEGAARLAEIETRISDKINGN
jgi:polyhydroxyalkanoate synthesis regulator phasin